MKWRKLIHKPFGLMSYFNHAIEIKDSNSASGLVVIDADWIAMLEDRMMDVAKSCDFETAEKISTAMTSFLSTCHCGHRAYKLIWNAIQTNFFQRVGSDYHESRMWRRDHPRAWAKFCRENEVEKYLEV